MRLIATLAARSRHAAARTGARSTTSTRRMPTIWRRLPSTRWTISTGMASRAKVTSIRSPTRRARIWSGVDVAAGERHEDAWQQAWLGVGEDVEQDGSVGAESG